MSDLCDAGIDLVGRGALDFVSQQFMDADENEAGAKSKCEAGI